MAHGFFRVAAAAPAVKVADCPRNADALLEEMKAAENQNVQLILFPELSLSGATCGDLFRQQSLTDAARRCLSRLADATKCMRLLACVGFPFAHGDRLYNAVALIGHGRLYGIVAKHPLADSGAGNGKRCFSSPSGQPIVVVIDGKECLFGDKLIFDLETEEGIFPFGIEIGEEGARLLPPSVTLAAAGALLIVHPCADNEAVGANQFQKTFLKARSASLRAAYLHAACGRGESTGEAVYGGFCAVAENGDLLQAAVPFEGKTIVCDIDFQRLRHERMRSSDFSDGVDVSSVQRVAIRLTNEKIKPQELKRTVSPFPFVPTDDEERALRCREVLRFQAEGLAQRLRQTGLKRAVLGLSGGLDSTQALAVAVTAFDLLGFSRSGILCVTMPGFGTTSRTKNNATGLAQAFGVELKEIPIHEAVSVHFKDIGHDPMLTDTVYENAQARERTQILMDLANQIGALVLGTGDLSELALGWATFNGDHMSMYGVNASVPKTLLRHLVQTYADTIRSSFPQAAKLLDDVLQTPVSPELLPPKEGNIAQCTESIVGPYELHDFFLYYTVRWGFSPEKIAFLAQAAFTEVNGTPYRLETILKWMKVFYRRFFSQQFKRNTLPEGAKIGSVSFSPRGDWMMPGDAEVVVWLEEIEKSVEST